MFEKLNTRRTIMAGVETDGLPFKKLSEVKNSVLSVQGFFFTEGKFGRQVTVVTKDALINMPKRAVAQFEAIEADEEMLKAVLDGGLEIKVESETVTRTGTTVKYELQDAQPLTF